MKLKNILLSVLASSVMVFANSSDAIQMSSVAFEEVVVVGKKDTTLKPLEKAIPGMVVTYVNTIKNTSNEAATNLVVVNPVPNDTIYVASTEETNGALMEYSVDGKEFNQAEKVFVNENGIKRVADSREYTHIKWTIAKLASNSEFKIKFQSKIK
jgi:uncharacterized repeat protein (TIGR01451 family)